jgi:DNA-binding NarL/FixJ family response regulator
MMEATAMAQSSSGVRVVGGKGSLHILIVDPKPQSRSTLKGSLLSLDSVQSVTERGSAVDLQALLRDGSVHLVMVDQDLGDHADPLEVIRSLKSSAPGNKTHYLLTGQHLDADVRNKAAGLGVTGFLSKPFDLHQLERAVWEGLGQRPPAGGESADAAPAVPKEVLERLKRVAVFADFTDAELLRLLKICRFCRVPAKEYLFREGDAGDRLYVLIAGQVLIQKSKGGQSILLDTKQPGSCFGEMAIIDSGPRSADAFAATDVMAIEIMGETVLKDNDMIALKLVRQLSVLLTHIIRDLLSKR